MLDYLQLHLSDLLMKAINCSLQWLTFVEREREREKRGVILYVSHISDSTFWCWFRNTHFNFHHPEFYSLRISWPVSNLHSSRSRSPLHIQFLQSISTFDTSFSSRFQTTFSNYSSTGNIFHVTCVVSDTSAFQHYTTRATFLTFHTSFSTCPHVLCFFTSFPHFISRPPPVSRGFHIL